MKKQYYKKIEFTDKKTFIFNKQKVFTYKLKDYLNVYVSKNCHIKPKGLHIILKNVNEALKDFGIKDRDFKILLLSYKDGMNTLGAYKAYFNEICFNETICDVKKLKLENIEIGHVERHEIWHLKQAENYRKKYGLITLDNYDKYINFSRIQAKKYLDSIGVNGDNVGVISEYAFAMYEYKKFDEVEAEIKAKKGDLCIARNFQKKYKN